MTIGFLKYGQISVVHSAAARCLTRITTVYCNGWFPYYRFELSACIHVETIQHPQGSFGRQQSRCKNTPERQECNAVLFLSIGGKIQARGSLKRQFEIVGERLRGARAALEEVVLSGARDAQRLLIEDR